MSPNAAPKVSPISAYATPKLSRSFRGLRTVAESWPPENRTSAADVLFPLPTSNPVTSRINIPEYLTKRAIDHRVVADRKQRPDVRFYLEAYLSATVGISELKARSFVDYPASITITRIVTSIDRADVGRKNSPLCRTITISLKTLHRRANDIVVGEAQAGAAVHGNAYNCTSEITPNRTWRGDAKIDANAPKRHG
ncbi:hypothetical protein V1283_001699 [Bradyrhizobium sp. AZCC 2262]